MYILSDFCTCTFTHPPASHNVVCQVLRDFLTICSWKNNYHCLFQCYYYYCKKNTQKRVSFDQIQKFRAFHEYLCFKNEHYYYHYKENSQKRVYRSFHQIKCLTSNPNQLTCNKCLTPCTWTLAGNSNSQFYSFGMVAPSFWGGGFAPKERIRNNRPRFPKVLFVVHEVDDALRQDADHVHRQWEEHHEKVAVVTPTYAVVQPRTVVIKCLKHNTITVTKKSMNKIQSFNFNMSSTKEPKLVFPCSLPTTSN